MNLRDLLMELDGEKLDKLAPKAFETLAQIEDHIYQPTSLDSLNGAKKAFLDFRDAVLREAE